MAKKLLFSSILTTLIALSIATYATETTHKNPQEKQYVNKQHVNKKARVKSHDKKVSHHDDAYKPKTHLTHNISQASEIHKDNQEVVLFTENKTQNFYNKKQDAIVNSDGISVKVGGDVDIQYGFIDQKEFFRHPASNENLPQIDVTKPASATQFQFGEKFTNQNAMTSNGKLKFTADKNEANNKYGVEIEARANTSPSSSGNSNFASKVYVFVENTAGRIEAGANDGASEAMSVSAASVAKATGGIDGDYTSWLPYGAISLDKQHVLNDTFLVYPTLPYASEHAKKANKLTYYTPTINGFKAGMSFVRDVTVQGTTYEALSFKGTGYRNVIEGGISYENKLEKVRMNLSATGQVGEARDAYIESIHRTQELKRLGAWQVGTKVSFEGLNLAGSYGNWGKSGTEKNPLAGTPNKKAQFWTAGLSYNHKDKGGVSLTYMNSEKIGAFALGSIDYIKSNQTLFDAAKQKFHALSFGAEYKVMPGLMPYAEVTTFNYKTPLTDVAGNKGTVVLGGVKLNF